jgi:hypothetical protein
MAEGAIRYHAPTSILATCGDFVDGGERLLASGNLPSVQSASVRFSRRAFCLGYLFEETLLQDSF